MRDSFDPSLDQHTFAGRSSVIRPNGGQQSLAEYRIQQLDSTTSHFRQAPLRSALQLHQHRRSARIATPVPAPAPADGRHQNDAVRIGSGFRSVETRHGLVAGESDDRSKRHRKRFRQGRQDAVAGGQHGATDQRSRQGWPAINKPSRLLPHQKISPGLLTTPFLLIPFSLH